MSTASLHETVVIRFASQCDRGKVREQNQDSVLQAAVPLGDLLMVADGIGGYQGGDIASRMAVEVFSTALAGMPTFFPPAIAIQEAACRANAEIVAAAAESGMAQSRMGTTVVLALLQQNPERPDASVQAWIGHIGDSRAYLVHHGRLRRITRDHSAMQLRIDRNLITPEEARQHPDAHVLTRTLGQEPNVEIELNEVELMPGDSLLLCSDGLWGFVAEREIEQVLADRALSVEEASRALLNLALDAGGRDNVGIELARLEGGSEPAALAEPADRLDFPASSAPQPGLAPELADIPIPKPAPDPAFAAGIAPESVAGIVAETGIAFAATPETALAQHLQTKTTLEPEFEYVPKFESADLPNSSFVRMVMILVLAFATSGALVYSALMQNWLGVDSLLH
jgi:PPM family protein phosphatase